MPIEVDNIESSDASNQDKELLELDVEEALEKAINEIESDVRSTRQQLRKHHDVISYRQSVNQLSHYNNRSRSHEY